MAEVREYDLEFSFTAAIRGFHALLTVKDAEVQITVGASSLQRKTSIAVSSYSSLYLSNYTRISRCEDLFAFYSTPNDCINNYF